MDHHHKFVGFTFAFLGAALIDGASHQLFEYDRVPAIVRDGDKIFVASVFILMFAIVQLVASVYLAFKPNFLKLWSFVHLGLAGVYLIISFVLTSKTSDRVFPRAYFPGLIQNVLFLAVVSAFNLVHTKLPSLGE